MQFLSYLYLFIQLLACLFAIRYWKNYRNSTLWIFLPFLIYSFLNELIAFLLLNMKIEMNVRFMYNIYIIVCFFVYLYWFDSLLKLKYWKWILTLIFIGLLVYDGIKSDFMTQLSKTALFFQAIIILFFSLFYFIRLLKSNAVIHFQKKPEFWIIMGLLVFYIAFIPLSLVSGKGLNIQLAYGIAINILNYILYTCYCIGFYVTGKR